MKNKIPPARIKRSEAFLGIHFDFHADMDCMAVGKTLTRTMLRKMLEPDFPFLSTSGAQLERHLFAPFYQDGGESGRLMRTGLT